MCKWNQIRAIFTVLSCDHLSKAESLSSTKIAVNSTTKPRPTDSNGSGVINNSSPGYCLGDSTFSRLGFAWLFNAFFLVGWGRCVCLES